MADTFKPPANVASAARRGLELRKKFKRGGTNVGARRGTQLANREPVSADTIKRMVSYFARHEVDKQGKNWGNESDPSPGYVAWLLWGGDAGRAWANRIAKQLEAATESRESDNEMGKGTLEEAVLLAQDKVGYVVPSPQNDMTCGNCRWYNEGNEQMPCQLIAAGPTAIVDAGWCMKWVPAPAERDSDEGDDYDMESAQESAPVLHTHVLVESIGLDEATKNDDMRTVEQVLIRAGRSANGRHYSTDVLQKAAPLFEGVRAYANHPTNSERKERPERSTAEITGWLSGVRWDESRQALVATRHFTSNAAGRDSWALVSDMMERNAPKTLVQASINAIGRGVLDKQTGTIEVESIEAVNSVDDVTTGAAGGRFERLIASSSHTLTADLLAAVTLDDVRAARPDLLQEHQQSLPNNEAALLEARASRDKAMQGWRESQAVEAQLRAKVDALQARERELTESLQVAQADAESKAEAVLLERTLREAALPAAWEDDLRIQLTEHDPADWPEIVQRERRKAKHAGAYKRIDVTNAPRLASDNADLPIPKADESPLPRADETYDQWLQRTAGAGKAR